MFEEFVLSMIDVSEAVIHVRRHRATRSAAARASTNPNIGINTRRYGDFRDSLMTFL
jgi:hypothetical protein